MAPPEPPRITVVGSINMDVSARTSSLPAPGETVAGTELVLGRGGKGANQAVAAARAGGNVRFVGAVGDDAFAPELRASLQADGIDTDTLRTTPGASGVAVVTVDDAAENTIVVVAGANDSLTELGADDVAAIEGADVLLLQLEIPVPTVVAAAEAARRGGTTVFLNPSPVRSVPDALFDVVDVLVVNESEHHALGAAVERTPHVVTTLGARGARHRGPDGAVTEVPAPRVQAIDTTGAGDAFTGALAVAWRDGPETAVRRAVVGGALATTRAGIAAPTAAEIDHAAQEFA